MSAKIPSVAKTEVLDLATTCKGPDNDLTTVVVRLQRLMFYRRRNHPSCKSKAPYCLLIVSTIPYAQEYWGELLLSLFCHHTGREFYTFGELNYFWPHQIILSACVGFWRTHISEFAISRCCTARQRKWQRNTTGLHCWISYNRGILNGINVAVAYNLTNRKLTSVSRTR